MRNFFQNSLLGTDNENKDCGERANKADDLPQGQRRADHLQARVGGNKACGCRHHVKAGAQGLILRRRFREINHP